MFLYDFLLNINIKRRWPIFIILWLLVILLWYFLVFSPISRYLSYLDMQLTDSHEMLNKLQLNNNDNKNLSYVDKQDVNELNNIILRYIQENNLILGECNVCQNANVCQQCLCFSVKSNFQNIFSFLKKIEELKYLIFCYCILKKTNTGDIMLNFGLKQISGKIIFGNSSSLNNINDIPNPFENGFLIECIGIAVSSNGLYYLVVKTANKIKKISPGDMIDRYKLLDLNDEFALFQNIDLKNNVKIALNQKALQLKK